MSIFAVSPQIVNSVNSGVTGPNVTKIVHDVEKFILLNLLKSELRYCNPFSNGSATRDCVTVLVLFIDHHPS